MYGSEAMRRFAQVDLEHIPDETTLCTFRHFLEAHELTAALFRLTTQYLADRAVLVQTGTIVDATISSASGSRRIRPAPGTGDGVHEKGTDVAFRLEGAYWQ